MWICQKVMHYAKSLQFVPCANNAKLFLQNIIQIDSNIGGR
jgi:hypothetical protein